MKNAPDALVDMSLELSRLIRRTIECGVDDVNVLRLHALGIVAEHKRMPMAEFASAMSISPSTATEFADRLMKCGYIRRMPDPKNRRTVLITLTPLGTRIVLKGKKCKEALLRKMFAGLSAKDRSDLKRVFRLLLQKDPS